jgi:hypothetical protein
MLEQIGASPQYSCEGHPDGFYVLFSAPIDIAVDVRNCGYFNVELEGEAHSCEHLWSIRLNHEKLTDNERQNILRWAANKWASKFGPIQPETINRNAPQVKQNESRRYA